MESQIVLVQAWVVNTLPQEGFNTLQAVELHRETPLGRQTNVLVTV